MALLIVEDMDAELANLPEPSTKDPGESNSTQSPLPFPHHSIPVQFAAMDVQIVAIHVQIAAMHTQKPCRITLLHMYYMHVCSL